MLFHKKKEQNSPQERRLEELSLQLYSKKELLISHVKNMIVKKEVINLYPDGADKKAAIKDFEKEQQHLLCRIGEYDDYRQQYINMMKRYQSEGIELNHSVPATSHWIIEYAYKSFFQR